MRHADWVARRAPDEQVHNTVDVHLGWRDRLRVVCGRTLHVRTVQNFWVGQDDSPKIAVGPCESMAWVEPLRRPKPHGLIHIPTVEVPAEVTRAKDGHR